jgi:serine phosphatase RsbU (regulator of sigma subunit)
VPDSYAVLVSDGVIPDGDDRWLKELIASFDGEEPRELSKAILESAISRTDSKDDMTVLAVRIEERQ